MSLYGFTGGAATEHFPGVEVSTLEPGLSRGEFEEFTASLVIPRHISMVGIPIAEAPATAMGPAVEMRRSPEQPREPWAPDHHWHTDRAYWGENQFATVLYAQALEGEVAGTEFIDTTVLLDTIERDQPGLTEILRPGTTIFSVAKYYADVLAVKGSETAIQRTLEQHDADDLHEVMAKEAAKHPPKRFPTTPAHPFRGEACLMLDEARAVDIEGTDLAPSEVQAIIEGTIKGYLALVAEELAERPYYVRHDWEPGQVVIMPQIGVMHRAQASPNGERRRNTLRQFIK